MSVPSEHSSDGHNMQSRLRNLYQAHKPEIQINLHRRRSVYSTLDKIEGVATIVAPTDTSFDDIEVEFVGTTRTYVERLTTAAAISGKSEAFHQFLKLKQPRLHEHLPEDRTLKAGQKYELPFVFVVPQQLLPRICQHKAANQSLRDTHLQLPPSFGDKEAEWKAESVDDMVPEMASIRYGVFARISKDKEEGGDTVKATIASKARRVRVVPATQEQPPLIVENDSEYTMRKERTIRKGVLQGKLGTLVVEASQPAPMRLQAHRTGEQQPSMATVVLRFDPVDTKSPPPRLGSMATRLKVCTYFASTARSTFPTKQASLLDLSQGMHSEQINLSSRCVASVEWTKHDGSKPVLERRDSGLSATGSTPTTTTPEPSETYKGKSYYTSKILVPLTLPSTKAFAPTFHTCLVSRVYQLKLELGLHTAGIGGTIDLKVPIQITSHSSGDASPRSGSIDSNMEMIMDDEYSDYFQSRTIHVPDDALLGRSRIGVQVVGGGGDDAPPGYSFYASQTGSLTVPVY
ncbi:hypothetical protein CLAFUW4_04332 [Fulvia fulva]|uniref:Bul1 N-terminal domain-containing protein n=1 Tax=Passalora fulva TaxID=5499 RepID=A0A9Q8P7I4_PASFU|nr:uncharacterized protein CLAFUR5_04296 [Fulvia fulva]KAK4626255.1 hypothetical protein CLAFUR4_04318 [Fulvia fulva]KAK4628679.1 hypothetical protein CLAFUR0_04320 [Fulvia fulva]UJO15932.1 hypothetical protein CLAFUR5_04296 [Fulvia fulva]WPV14125.1 hypothetical protein CLAFUW4_04332 [Fulvia fulva]WPV29236.1 hypothetical protein CLAFUW7_04321 [Fulvia fulva]